MLSLALISYCFMDLNEFRLTLLYCITSSIVMEALRQNSKKIHTLKSGSLMYVVNISIIEFVGQGSYTNVYYNSNGVTLDD